MNNSHELVAQWRNSAENNNPAGPLFAAGAFAEDDIVWDCGGNTSPGCSCNCGTHITAVISC